MEELNSEKLCDQDNMVSKNLNLFALFFMHIGSP